MTDEYKHDLSIFGQLTPGELDKVREMISPRAGRVFHVRPESEEERQAALSQWLKPCPFCGAKAHLVQGDEVAAVQCERVSFHRLILDGDNNVADEVCAAWNDRPDLATPQPDGGDGIITTARLSAATRILTGDEVGRLQRALLASVTFDDEGER